MTKKSFKGGFDEILSSSAISDKPTKKTQQNTLVTRSFQFNEETLESIRNIAYFHHKTLKDVMEQALTFFINYYIEKYGEIKQRPDSNKDNI